MNWGQGDDFKSSQDISMTMCENDFVITRVQGTELSIMEIQTLSMISINPAPQKFTSQTALHSYSLHLYWIWKKDASQFCTKDMIKIFRYLRK